PARDEFLRACGYRVLRFRNDDVLSNPANLAQRIAEAIRAPSPSGRGGKGVRVHSRRSFTRANSEQHAALSCMPVSLL
ncbi:MAG: DUF559 domain-containing protein, partial [Myxococcales bacterium]|nr:DUF559 domain-containing protein [Myxococcales bacterium]